MPHGTTNSVTHLQSSLTHTLPDDIKSNLLQWFDDFLLHDSSIENFLKLVRGFPEYFAYFNCKLHPVKLILFTRSVRLCRRFISAEEIMHYPSKLDNLLEMSRPVTGGQLPQFLSHLMALLGHTPVPSTRTIPTRLLRVFILSLETHKAIGCMRVTGQARLDPPT